MLTGTDDGSGPPEATSKLVVEKEALWEIL